MEGKKTNIPTAVNRVLISGPYECCSCLKSQWTLVKYRQMCACVGSDNTEPPTVLILQYCTDFRGKVLKEYTKVLKFGLQNEHNWSIIGKILTEALKCHEKYWNSENFYWFRVLKVGGSGQPLTKTKYEWKTLEIRRHTIGMSYLLLEL